MEEVGSFTGWDCWFTGLGWVRVDEFIPLFLPSWRGIATCCRLRLVSCFMLDSCALRHMHWLLEGVLEGGSFYIVLTWFVHVLHHPNQKLCVKLCQIFSGHFNPLLTMRRFVKVVECTVIIWCTKQPSGWHDFLSEGKVLRHSALSKMYLEKAWVNPFAAPSHFRTCVINCKDTVALQTTFLKEWVDQCKDDSDVYQ